MTKQYWNVLIDSMTCDDAFSNCFKLYKTWLEGNNFKADAKAIEWLIENNQRPISGTNLFGDKIWWSWSFNISPIGCVDDLVFSSASQAVHHFIELFKLNQLSYDWEKGEYVVP